jgi:hypothetical protein
LLSLQICPAWRQAKNADSVETVTWGLGEDAESRQNDRHGVERKIGIPIFPGDGASASLLNREKFMVAGIGKNRDRLFWENP